MDMKIIVHAKPLAKENKIEKVDDTTFVVSVKEPPIQGRANQAICALLAEYFHTSKSRVSIVSGYTSRRKIIVIQ